MYLTIQLVTTSERILASLYYRNHLSTRGSNMKKTTWLLRIVGTLQVILGIFYLFTPDYILNAMGHTLPQADIHYPLAMLAARFIAYGIAFIFISSDPLQHKLWIYFMVLIQAIDLGAGVFYTSTGIVSLTLSGFPMFNAAGIIVLLMLWMPKNKNA